ncbi:MAG: hypothetical protein P4K83_01320 [Terracidiphilus sp.]|nr:hypothetical protein [Terracidiphilus sp.]
MKITKNLYPHRMVAALVLFACMCWPAAAAPRHAKVASFDPNVREIFSIAMDWGDKYWDAATGLCRQPESPSLLPGKPYDADASVPDYFMVRESSIYALGLLLRDGPGDRGRAARILDVVLKMQYRDPGKRWDGTFRRSPNEQYPGEHAVRWIAYDPNWREFIGTDFAIILNDYPDRIPHALAARMMESIDYAISGEIGEKRLIPGYSNIALMYGYLWSFAAEKGGKPQWKQPAEEWQESVYKLFKEHDAFSEYNSPTYYGTDLYGLALWRNYGLTERTRAMGREMEDGLWRATADFYNANLRNVSGPYDRAYGMDMQSYVSVVGLCLRLALSADKAPLVRLDHPPVDHVPDLWFIPALAILDVRIPDDAMRSFRSLQAEHEVRRPIQGERIATAWIGKTLIYGGEITGRKRGVEFDSQFHPVTAQWLTSGNKIGWMNLIRSPYLDADATKKGLAITSLPGVFTFRIATSGIVAGQATARVWALDGLTVYIDTDGNSFKTLQGEGYIDVTYTGVSRMNLSFTQNQQ